MSPLCVLSSVKPERQVVVPVKYKGKLIGEHRLDLLVEGLVVLELKSVERFDSIFEAQILSYLRMARKPVGLIINFNTRLLKEGIRRYVV